MFERFSASARHVVKGAQAQARQLGHPYIGTEHLLLALLEPEAAVAHAVLREAGMNADKVREEIDRLIGPTPGVLTDEDSAALRTIGIDLRAVLDRLEQSLGPDALTRPLCPPPRRGLLSRRLGSRSASTRSGPRFGPRAKKALELSLREALALRHSYIGAEHILLGLLREGEGVAAQVLTNAGLDSGRLRQATLAALHDAA
jgi:ATP-dependent Clp protease ATP-binding subunit ClpA